ncbi:hypothetical protein ACFYTF_23425 [Nocardia thailandica]|uniref:Lipoprotein n=1 Tax=Nocardia thailandica TaxID=257275 RepID=A0ABW6PTN8_9NOCA
MNTRTRTALGAFAVFAALATASCTSDADNDDGVTTSAPVPHTSHATTSAPASTSAGGAAAVSPEASRQLCDMIGAELDNWRSQGTTVAKVSFNGTVHNWAARNDGLNEAIISDNGIVDTVTTATCPDVRTQALEVLGTDTLASALAGFDR